MLRGRFDDREVRRAMRRLGRRTPRIAAQELNRLMRRSRTEITKRYVSATQVRPQRRVRNRVLLPRAGKARAGKLRAFGIALIHYVPARWFITGRGRKKTFSLPAGLTLATTQAATVGRPFIAQTKRGAASVFRRGEVPERRETRDGEPTWLPIKEGQVDSVSLGNRIIAAVVRMLGGEFVPAFEARMRREIRRSWRA